MSQRVLDQLVDLCAVLAECFVFYPYYYLSGVAFWVVAVLWSWAALLLVPRVLHAELDRFCSDERR